MPWARRAGDRSWRRWVLRLSVAAALAVAMATLPYHLVGGAGGAQLARMTAELDRTRAQIATQKRENAELGRDIKALKNDPAAIEDIARRELGMVRPGEVVLRLESFDPGDEDPARRAGR